MDKLLLVAVVILLVLIGPLVIIWSMNTLFPLLAIPYNIWTWLATVTLKVAITGGRVLVRK